MKKFMKMYIYIIYIIYIIFVVYQLKNIKMTFENRKQNLFLSNKKIIMKN